MRIFVLRFLHELKRRTVSGNDALDPKGAIEVERHDTQTVYQRNKGCGSGSRESTVAFNMSFDVVLLRIDKTVDLFAAGSAGLIFISQMKGRPDSVLLGKP